MKVFEIVAVYDNLTEAYLEPRFFPSIAEAERVFTYQINSIPLWKANSNDYDLYSLGTFDQESGHIDSVVHKICSGRSVLKEEKNDTFSDQSA